MPSNIYFPEDELTPRLKLLPGKFSRSLAAFAAYQAPKFQAYARSNAPWQDQTGNARQGLFATGLRDGKKHYIVVYHTMPYGPFLETRWDGKYGIILDTLKVMGEKMMLELSYFMRKIK